LMPVISSPPPLLLAIDCFVHLHNITPSPPKARRIGLPGNKTTG